MDTEDKISDVNKRVVTVTHSHTQSDASVTSFNTGGKKEVRLLKHSCICTGNQRTST